MGALYEGILVFGILAMVFSFIAGIVGFLWTFGKFRGPSRGSFVQSSGVVLIVLSLVIVVVVPVLQPVLFTRGVGGICPSGANSPCNSFWGSTTSAGETMTWGADAGWYLAIATLILLISAVVVWRVSRFEPWDASTTPAVFPAPATSNEGPAFQPGAPTVQVYTPNIDQSLVEPQTNAQQKTAQSAAPIQAAPPPERYCPACGAPNARTSGFCETCGRPLPHRP